MNCMRVTPNRPLRYAVNKLDSPPTRLVAIMFCATGSPIRDSLRCSRSMKLGIHSAPDRVSIGSTVGASSSNRPPPAHPGVDHQARELFDGGPRGRCRRKGHHRARADIVVDGAHEFVTVGEAFIEIALGERGLSAHGTNGQRRSPVGAEQLDTGGDEVVSTYGDTALQRYSGPAAPSLTGLHFSS